MQNDLQILMKQVRGSIHEQRLKRDLSKSSFKKSSKMNFSPKIRQFKQKVESKINKAALKTINVQKSKTDLAIERRFEKL